MVQSISLAVILCLGIMSPAFGQIIDHTDIARVATLPQSVMDRIGQQKWFFSHASVGGNMMNGMSALRSSNNTRYKLVGSSIGYNSALQQANNPPNPTLGGRIYDCPRSNPGWSNKFTIFDNSVRLAGWRYPAVTAAMDKLCYVDQTANAATYCNMMAALEADYPDTVFVYTTMPLKTDTDSNNVLRNQYNNEVRAYCITNKKLLFDIADIEANDPDGNQSTFTSGGNTYQRLYSGYTSDGGHLNTAGAQRVSLGWYAVAAAIVPIGLSCGDAYDFMIGQASTNYRFAVWGMMSIVDESSFTLDDGSGAILKVIAPGYSSVIAAGDYVRAAGALDNSTNPPTLKSAVSNIKKLQ